MNTKLRIMDLHSNFHPKQPSPRNPVDQAVHDKIYNQGWNDCMAHLKAAGRI